MMARAGFKAAIVAAAAWAAAAPVAAQTPNRYALVIGVGRYAAPSIRPLDGPALDAPAVAAELTARWGFPAANIRILIDAQATRANILAGLDWLVSTTKSGDQVVVYYSGHGTSRADRNALHYGLYPGSGAIFPYDVSTESEDRAMATLLVGRRDLRPRLQALDQGRTVIVVLDSCYSENAARNHQVPAAKPPGTSKAEPLFGALQDFVAPPEREAYPYRNIVSLSAASEAEPAMDIGIDDIRGGVRTIDNRPKGALTDALLRGLRGDANTDNDGVLTLNELFQFVREDVAGKFQHTPQMTMAESRLDLAALPLFAVPKPALGKAPVMPVGFRIRADGLPTPLLTQIGARPGTSVVTANDSEYHVRLVARGDEIHMLHRSGDLLEKLPARDTRSLVDRVSRQEAAQRLLNIAYPSQSFNVRIAIPSTTGVLRAETDGKENTYTLSWEVDAPASMLVLNVDKQGYVSVIVPTLADHLKPATKGALPGIRVTKPDGTEFLKAFAFRTAPPWLAALQRLEVAGADAPEIGQLIERLRGLRDGVAQTTLKIVTLSPP